MEQMASGNISIPDDLLAQAQAIAAKQGRTADELTTYALKREIARELIAGLQRSRKPSGMTEEQELHAAVDAVHDCRRGR